MSNVSVIIPVYNRPKEVEELLQSLAKQTYKDFEIVIVEDGSILTSESVCKAYETKLNIQYFFKTNSGPGSTRNYGMEKSTGDFFVILDSDCIVPPHYMQTLHQYLENQQIEFYGGPDAAHPSFTDTQKAVNYSMTSFFTTGGIRGGQKNVHTFLPRSFNMGFSKKVFETTKGYAAMRYGEDIDLSLRTKAAGFQPVLLKELFVYHKRRTNFIQFFKQIYHSGFVRIELNKRHQGSFKIIHLFPSLFVLGVLSLLILSVFNWYFILPVLLFCILVFFDSLLKNKSIAVACLSIVASFVQTFGYGIGFIVAGFQSVFPE